MQMNDRHSPWNKARKKEGPRKKAFKATYDVAKALKSDAVTTVREALERFDSRQMQAAGRGLQCTQTDSCQTERGDGRGMAVPHCW